MDCQPFVLNYDSLQVPESQIYVVAGDSILGAYLTLSYPLSAVAHFYLPNSQVLDVDRNLFVSLPNFNALTVSW